MTVRRAVRAVLITQDAKVRETVGEYARNGGSFAVSLDLDVSLAGFTGPQFKVVEQSAPALVLMDFDGAPDLGVSLARDLTRANQQLVPVGMGSPLSSDQLLAAMRVDKKARGSRLRFVVLDALARPAILEAPSDELLARAYEEISS